MRVGRVTTIGVLLAACLLAFPDRSLQAVGPSGPAVAADAVARLDAVDISGRRWTAGDLRGRVILIDFWATWCAPCLADLPRLKALHARHSRSDFEIVGVSLDATSRRTFVSWLNRNRIEWPQIHEPGAYGAATARLFGVDHLPVTILVDRDGSVAAVNLRGAELAARVDSMVQSSRLEGRR
jgi:thiol-disulfide isomerase/thioredoxin